MVSPIELITTTRPDYLREARELLDKARRDKISYHASPLDWRDEVLYFLLPDRFSDGEENSRELLDRNQIRQLRETPNRLDWNWQQWAESGKRWQGGTINGIRSQLPYLKQLGVTAIWVGPIFKQRARLDTYHGYGIQDFLDVDPRFGSRKDLLMLVADAHELDMRIILDIIANHSGDNWGYVAPGSALDEVLNEPAFRPWPDYYGNPFNTETQGWSMAWRDERQRGFSYVGSDISNKHDGVWPKEFQSSRLYTRAGLGNLGGGEFTNPHAEHKRTDFFSLKDLALDVGEVLHFLSDVYKYWIALTDCDGFRIDTVKHMSLEDTRNFCGAIREFSDSIGKRNFLLVGEIAGGDYFQDYVLDNLAVLQRNLSAALDIGSARLNLQNAAKGLAPAGYYLNGFKDSSEGFESHRQFGDRHVSILNDHDHVFGKKLRFSAEIPDDSPVKDYHVVAATAFQLFTLGIPCIYYGTEQAFAGPAHSQLPYVRSEGWDDPGNHGDRYLREAMFGPEHPRSHHDNDLDSQVTDKDTSLPGFGPFGTVGKHCFDQSSPAYIRISHLAKVRFEHPVLRIGRQYARQTRVMSSIFNFPGAGEMAAWSRILDNQEAVCIVNPNGNEARGGDVIVSALLCPAGTQLTVVANTAQIAAGGDYHGTHPIGSTVMVKGQSHEYEPAYIEVREVQPAEVLVLIRMY